MSGLPTMDDLSALYKWAVGSALGLCGYFIRDQHDQFKEHLKESAERDKRLVAVETLVPTIDARLANIEGTLQRLLERE